ncbi:3-dehydroquinate dehydratase [Terriglobus roseus DSM 18391]|uniref:Multifunctional fusion protein n=1 Tax=Terriglobus roseus (strain DSM 18391 / NRRL B-41598 / KBS 63) TaxID=926566 RepID=I3ZDQ7_TERRK|nr:shikimate dehydrogenase [Terriglobus roseus]AFL87375.1 3-dehydroquinate dehydratase [Terriglobus roseus DSM 18391]
MTAPINREEKAPANVLPASAGRVCVAVSGDGMIALAAETVRTNPFVEFRLDSLADPAAMLPALRQFLFGNRDVTAVATCRRKAFGGDFGGDARAQIAILREAALAGCRLVDIEVETAEELGQAALEELRGAGAAVILSWHDFQATPELEPVLERMRPFAPDVYKIVPTAKTLRDALRLIDVLEKHGGEGNLVAMSMGFKGTLTRVLGPRFGSLFTFASADGHGGTAPGQVSVSVLRELYRVDEISSQTAIYAVAGEPITGSMSPRMQNTAFADAGMDAVYLPLETSDPKELLEVAERLNIRGLSITMPLKELVMPLLAFRDRSVEQAGACNTLLRHRDGKLAGFNTDIAGIVEPLARRITLKGARVLVLGAGGAARAAVYGLVERGATVFLLNRTTERAEMLAAESGARVQARETLAETYFDAILNSTPYGMRGQTMDAPITQAEMNCRVFFDLVYNPLETPLIVAARARGAEIIPGVAMFVEQGARQFSLWTERAAPEGEMLRVVREALNA